MQFIQTYEDLCNQTLRNRKQFWYYTILVNPYDYSRAGEMLISNLEWFHLDSGEDCVYFIPGFLNTPDGIYRDTFNLPKQGKIIEIPNLGLVQFFVEDFKNCIHHLEIDNQTRWRYSGECELLLFNLDENGRIIPNDFAAYNLDDVIRNGRNLSSFIRETINVGKDATDKISAKRQLDYVYSYLIMPPLGYCDDERYNLNTRNYLGASFLNQRYYFISYSSKDYKIVSDIRNQLEIHGIKCWMAPRDIMAGENYAHVIEFAIKNSDKFILMLSERSVQSVWVEKEIQRAIHYFQHSHATKILPVWIDKQLDLNTTPIAFVMEGIQVAGVLNEKNDYKMLLSLEERINLKEKEAINVDLELTLRKLDCSIVTKKSICAQFQKALASVFTFVSKIQLQRFGNENFISSIETLKHACNRLRDNIQKMKTDSSENQSFGSILEESIELLDNIQKQIKDIKNAIMKYEYL